MLTKKTKPVKETIESHFAGDFLPFYQHYLPDLKKNGKEHRCCCPFHDDKTPSFSVYGDDSRQFKCFGCNDAGDIFDFYQMKCGVTSFPEILSGIAAEFGINGTPTNPEPSKRLKLIEKYAYTDAAGEVLYYNCRYEPKTFRQSNAEGGWGVKGIPKVPYNLPAVMGADTVWIAEGEKDVATLGKLGFVGSCNTGGGGNWTTDLNEYFKGKEVILLPDNDEPGRKHMAKVAEHIRPFSKSIKLLELPGIPEKGDVSDWVSSFSDMDSAAERLAIMADGLPEYEPAVDVPIPKAGKRFELISAGAFRKLDIPERVYFINPVLTSKSITLISGARGVGKTFFALGMIDAAARGQGFGPWECATPARCCYVDGEMPSEDIRERVKLMNISDDVLILSNDHATESGTSTVSLALEDSRNDFLLVLKDNGIQVVAFDNIGCLAPGLDENCKADWDPVNQWLLELRFAGISPVLLHHTGKNGDQRGTSAREDNISTSILLSHPKKYMPTDGCRFVCHFSKSRVPHSKLKLIEDVEFQLMEGEDLEYIWTHTALTDAIDKTVLKIIDENDPKPTQREIATLLDTSQSAIYRVIKKMRSKHYIQAEKLKLTQSGHTFVYGDSA